MTLKAILDTLEGVEEPLRALYVARDDGRFGLAVDGLVPKERLDEFRNNNVALKQERDALAAKFEGIDPEEYRKLADKAARERDKKLIDAGRVDELVAERTAAMKAEFDREKTTLGSERDALRTQLQGLVIDGAIRDAAGKAGVRPTAVEDALLRGRAVFRLVDGRATAMDGDKPLYGKTGEPMEIGEWIGSLATSAPHLFEASTGGGAQGGGGGRPMPANTVSRADTKGFLANLDAIAKGAVKVA